MQQQYYITVAWNSDLRNLSVDAQELVTLGQILPGGSLPTNPGKFQLNCVLNFLGVGLFQNVGTVASPNFLPLNPGLVTAGIHITSAQILNMGSVPVVLVPAQGPNTIIDVLSVAGFIDFGGVAYATHTNLDVNEGGTLWTNNQLLPSAVDVSKIFTQNGGATMTPNTALTITASGGNPTAGTGSLNIYVTYKVYSLI